MSLADDLKAIEARIAAASPGPWLDNQRTGTIDGPDKDGRHVLTGYEYDIKDEDCRFIAAARSDVPALVEMVRLLAHAVWEHGGDMTEGERDAIVNRLWAEAKKRAGL